MEFAQPIGFWLGLAGVGVLAAHLVRRRAKRITVPFLPLWNAVLEGQRGGFGSALSRWLDLILMLLACAAVTVAAGAPYVPGTPSTVRDLVLVLDGGIELRAGERMARQRKVAAAEIRRRAPGTRIVLVGVADEGAQVWSGTDRARALQLVREHRPGWLPAHEAEALALAREASRTLRAPDRVFLSARPISPDGFRVRRFGGAVKNVGIVGLEVLADPEGRGRVARLRLRGKGKVEIDGRWSGDVDGETIVDLPLPPGGKLALHARAEKDDFWCDDTAFLRLPSRKLPRLMVVAEKETSPFLTAALQALEKTGVVKGPLGSTTPEHAAAAARSVDVLVFDRCSPVERLAGARAIYIAPPPGALPFKVGEKRAAPALFDVQRAHPLLTGFDFDRIPPREATAILGGEAVAHAAPGPVLATGRGWIALGFDPDRSVFAASPAYPLFLRNCIAALSDLLPDAEAEFYAVGEPAPKAGVADVEGRARVRIGERLLGPPGFWTIDKKEFAVSLLQPDIDLRGPTRESDPVADVGNPGVPDKPLTLPFAAAAVLMLLVSWWVFWRG